MKDDSFALFLFDNVGKNEYQQCSAYYDSVPAKHFETVFF
jgi:hypothetical protein